MALNVSDVDVKPVVTLEGLGAQSQLLGARIGTTAAVAGRELPQPKSVGKTALLPCERAFRPQADGA